MKPSHKHYAPLTNFEQRTGHCPLYLAWRILDEARDYYRSPLPEAYADKMAHRAEAVFAKHPFWQRKFQSRAGREQLLTTMRHWLAALLAREQPALFQQMPENFKIGFPLPRTPQRPFTRKSSTKRRVACLSHGCELLTV